MNLVPAAAAVRYPHRTPKVASRRGKPLFQILPAPHPFQFQEEIAFSFLLDQPFPLPEGTHTLNLALLLHFTDIIFHRIYIPV